MRSLVFFKGGLKFFSFFFIYLAVVLFIGACSCGKTGGGNGDQGGGSGNKDNGSGSGGNQNGGNPNQTGDNPGNGYKGWGVVTTNAPWSDRSAFEALVFNDRLWVLGGGDGSDAGVTDKIWSSPDGTNWTQVVPPGNSWVARHTFQAEVFQNRIWVLGGVAGRRADSSLISLTDIWSSPDGTNWTEITPTGVWAAQGATDGFRGLQVVAFKNKLWVLGKFFDNNILQSDDGVAWSQVTPGAAYWPRRITHEAIVFDGKMWVVGGDDGRANYDDVWGSDDGLIWTDYTAGITTTAGTTWKKRKIFEMAVFDGKMWVMGGGTDKPVADRAYYNDTWTTTNGTRWEQLYANGPWDIRTSFKAVDFKGSLWILGGAVHNGGVAAPRSDVWRLDPVK